jgi:tetratricopeptide (TPR) repeat protein
MVSNAGMTQKKQVPPQRSFFPVGACLLIFAATLVAYLPALRAGFIWDDFPGHVTRPDLRSLSGLARIWFEPGATQQYYPLLHSAFWVEHRLWGDAPFGYHLVNVLLHATAACLVGAVLRRLALPGAWFAALLFALHPVGVESVAWISEQKNTLSTVLYLCAALAYFRFDDERRGQLYAVATLLFTCALLSKTVTATLPAALLVVCWWRRGGLEWRRDFAPLLPWFVLSTGAGALTTWIERAQVGAQGVDFALGPMERVLLAGRALWFYFGKLIWPADLIFVYPRWTVDASEAWQWLFALGAAAVLIAFWLRRKSHRGPLAAWLFFAGTLFPALGFVNVFPFLYSFVADHFQYLACIGILAFIAAGAARLFDRVPAFLSRMGAVVILAALGLLTSIQAATYRDVFTLYRTTIAKNPACWMAHNNLAIALVDTGQVAEALPHYERALALRANYAEAENNYGYALTQLNRNADALVHLQRAIQLKADYAEAHNNLGAALMRLGRSVDGIAAFTEAARLNPSYPVAQFNLALALAATGKPEDAIPHFQRALTLNPNYAEAELNLGIALTVTGHVADGIPHFERALQLHPNLPHAHNSFGRALASLGRFDEAIARFRSALELQPNFAEAHYNLALALRQTGRLDEAEQQLMVAQQLGWR